MHGTLHSRMCTVGELGQSIYMYMLAVHVWSLLLFIYNICNSEDNDILNIYVYSTAVQQVHKLILLFYIKYIII